MVMDGGAYLSLLARQGLSAQEARENLVEKLSALWETVFGDGPEYTSVFFDTAFCPEDSLLWTEGTEPVSMLFLLPVFLRIPSGETVRGRYVYAVATHPAHRGKGCCGALLRAADVLTEKRGERFTSLHPASDSLYGFYGRFGYQTAFSCTQTVLPQRMDSPENAGMELLSQPDFEALYRKLSAGRENELLWSDTALPFLYREAQLQGGGAFAVNAAGERIACGLYYEMEPGKLLVKDLACRELSNVLPVLRNVWPGIEISLRISQKMTEKWAKGSVSQPFGMIKYMQKPFDGGALCHENGFMGAVLD